MIWFYGVLGLLVGVLSGMVGIGGGIVIVPMLVYFGGMTQHKAQGTSLGALLLPIGALAFWEYYKAGNVDVKVAIIIAITFTIGGYFGGRYAQQVPEVMLRRIFAVVLILAAVRMLTK
jgi:uncharacterized membrane protein YfcA